MMGMGTTFIVLTLLWFIIVMVSKAINSTQNKAKPSAEVKPAVFQITVKNSVNQTTANVEVTNDSELVAVITAAIAAMEGNAINPGNLIIRKINRISETVMLGVEHASEVLDSRKNFNNIYKGENKAMKKYNIVVNGTAYAGSRRSRSSELPSSTSCGSGSSSSRPHQQHQLQRQQRLQRFG